MRRAVDLGAVRRRVESPAVGEGELSLLELEWMLAVMVANRLATSPVGSRERDQALDFKAHVRSVLALAQRECRGLVYKPPRDPRGGRRAPAAKKEKAAAGTAPEKALKSERGAAAPGGQEADGAEGGGGDPAQKSARRGGGATGGSGGSGGEAVAPEADVKTPVRNRRAALSVRSEAAKGRGARRGGKGAGSAGAAGGRSKPGASLKRQTTPRTAERWAKMSIKKRWLEQARLDGPLKSPTPT